MKTKIDLNNLGSGSVASALAMGPSTVRNMFVKGFIEHWSIPNPTNPTYAQRRTNIDHLIAFCEKNEYPICFVQGFVEKHFGHDRWIEIVKLYNENRPPVDATK